MDLPATRDALPWYSRIGAWTRVLFTGRAAARAALPTGIGVATARIASGRSVAGGASMLQASPTTYAALMRRSLSLAGYPVRAYEGYGAGDTTTTVLDPDVVPWAAKLARLIELPSPADRARLLGPYPTEPGEMLIAQVVCDVLGTGNAWVAAHTDRAGDIVGQQRLMAAYLTLEVRGGVEGWRYAPPGPDVWWYPRQQVAHIRLLRSGTERVLATGAYPALAPLLQAEGAAMRQTAAVVEQGGADVIVSGKDPTSIAFLSQDANRTKIAQQLTEALTGGPDQRRVMVLGGALDVRDSGLTPADLRAPELMTAARSADLLALGVTPVAVGLDAGPYSAAVQQYRVQAELDEQLASVLEVCWLRPLAQEMARREGGQWARQAHRVSCRLDLSTHPGWAFLRTEALGRMSSLVDLGWTPEQAAGIEGLDLPTPEGEINPNRSPAPPPAAEAAPARPVGEAAGGSAGRARSWLRPVGD